jgi:hypothetical protein
VHTAVQVLALVWQVVLLRLFQQPQVLLFHQPLEQGKH